MSVFIPVYRLQLVRDANFRTEAKQIREPRDVAAILSAYLAGADREHFVVLTLDTKGRVTGLHTAAVGTLDNVDVHPRDVFKFAIAMNAFAIIVGHVHPSGDPEPSRQDRAITRRLIEAGDLLGIPLWDHLVIGDNGSSYVSLTQGVSHSARSVVAEFR
ncbi:JAB domain-containing protein [Sulfobacillus harzensis]|uniref:JAB domain-containing protein n=1 Tax=Sulfobacillus harzensis TaxID=2729629 RepID=A0A7Y0L8S9_9FIRM|nr:JAB domain-containing protein [Sulfobacillus harzensis]NMP24600.1 JAB domain-containing protein [Sulfobacillus harzensis]